MTETHYTFACLGVDGERIPCWLAAFTDTPCEGRMEKAHLITKQVIRKEILRRPARKHLDYEGAEVETVLWDQRVWRPACRGHHTMLDQSRTLRVPRLAIPEETVAFAREHGILWWIEREYGVVEEQAA